VRLFFNHSNQNSQQKTILQTKVFPFYFLTYCLTQTAFCALSAITKIAKIAAFASVGLFCYPGVTSFFLKYSVQFKPK
jgi:hypothetical protein